MSGSFLQTADDSYDSDENLKDNDRDRSLTEVCEEVPVVPVIKDCGDEASHLLESKLQSLVTSTPYSDICFMSKSEEDNKDLEVLSDLVIDYDSVNTKLTGFSQNEEVDGIRCIPSYEGKIGDEKNDGWCTDYIHYEEQFTDEESSEFIEPAKTSTPVLEVLRESGTSLSCSRTDILNISNLKMEESFKSRKSKIPVLVQDAHDISLKCRAEKGYPKDCVEFEKDTNELEFYSKSVPSFNSKSNNSYNLNENISVSLEGHTSNVETNLEKCFSKSLDNINKSIGNAPNKFMSTSPHTSSLECLSASFVPSKSTKPIRSFPSSTMPALGDRCVSAMSLSERESFPNKIKSKSLSRLNRTESSSMNSMISQKSDYSHVQSKVKKYIQDMKDKHAKSRPATSCSCSAPVVTTKDVKSDDDIYVIDSSALKGHFDEFLSKEDLPADILQFWKQIKEGGNDPAILKQILQLLLQERHSLHDRDATIACLQLNFDNLLVKYSEAKRIIDDLRFCDSEKTESLESKTKHKLNKVLRDYDGQPLDDFNEPQYIKSTSYPIVKPSFKIGIRSHKLGETEKSLKTDEKSKMSTNCIDDEKQPFYGGHASEACKNLQSKIQDFSLLLNNDGLKAEEREHIWSCLLLEFDHLLEEIPSGNKFILPLSQALDVLARKYKFSFDILKKDHRKFVYSKSSDKFSCNDELTSTQVMKCIGKSKDIKISNAGNINKVNKHEVDVGVEARKISAESRELISDKNSLFFQDQFNSHNSFETVGPIEKVHMWQASNMDGLADADICPYSSCASLPILKSNRLRKVPFHFGTEESQLNNEKSGGVRDIFGMNANVNSKCYRLYDQDSGCPGSESTRYSYGPPIGFSNNQTYINSNNELTKLEIKRKLEKFNYSSVSAKNTSIVKDKGNSVSLLSFDGDGSMSQAEDCVSSTSSNVKVNKLSVLRGGGRRTNDRHCCPVSDNSNKLRSAKSDSNLYSELKGDLPQQNYEHHNSLKSSQVNPAGDVPFTKLVYQNISKFQKDLNHLKNQMDNFSSQVFRYKHAVQDNHSGQLPMKSSVLIRPGACFYSSEVCENHPEILLKTGSSQSESDICRCQYVNYSSLNDDKCFVPGSKSDSVSCHCTASQVKKTDTFDRRQNKNTDAYSSSAAKLCKHTLESRAVNSPSNAIYGHYLHTKSRSLSDLMASLDEASSVTNNIMKTSEHMKALLK